MKILSLISSGVLIVVPDPMEVMEGEELELCLHIYPPESLKREVNLIFDLIQISTFAGNQIFW
jgi:hypothetical protein